jgi:hypothetical protein
MRCRSSQLALAEAVRKAVHVLFRFRYRASQSKALWCGSGRVWLGRETFLHWALFDAQIDIPWVVATSREAPKDAKALREAVRAELAACWADDMDSLPRTENPNWYPLP